MEMVVVGTLTYVWKNYWRTLKRGKPSMRAFSLFLKLLSTEIKILLIKPKQR